MPHDRISLGKKGEELVADHLQQQGFVIKQMNYTRRCGEIDIIAEKESTRVFVEVKLRRTAYFATSQVINTSKQRKIIMAARYYNSEQKTETPMIYRFDVALLESNVNDFTLTYIPNAFTQQSEWS